MKISLSMVKNILMEVRDFDFFSKDEFSLLDTLVQIESKKINTICKEIAGKELDYAGDIFGEEGAVEVISDFLLNIISSWEKSRNFRLLMEKFLPPKIVNILNSQAFHK